MNEEVNLGDTVLNDEEEQSTAPAADPATDSATVTVAVVAPPEATVSVRKRVGRKVDTAGKTALGAARILYSQNKSLSPKALKELFLSELGQKFNLTKPVAQTYVSLVRKGSK